MEIERDRPFTMQSAKEETSFEGMSPETSVSLPEMEEDILTKASQTIAEGEKELSREQAQSMSGMGWGGVLLCWAVVLLPGFFILYYSVVPSSSLVRLEPRAVRAVSIEEKQIRITTIYGETIGTDIVPVSYYFADGYPVKIIVDPKRDGTYVSTTYHYQERIGGSYEDITIFVKDSATKQKWIDAINEVAKKYYKPRDVVPEVVPPSSPSNIVSSIPLSRQRH